MISFARPHEGGGEVSGLRRVTSPRQSERSSILTSAMATASLPTKIFGMYGGFWRYSGGGGGWGGIVPSGRLLRQVRTQVGGLVPFAKP